MVWNEYTWNDYVRRNYVRRDSDRGLAPTAIDAAPLRGADAMRVSLEGA
jgi:hypothetical protein